MLKKFWQSNGLWEGVGYVLLALAVFGQIAVGYWYLLAQGAFLVSNLLSVLRDFVLDLPRANKVKDICFTAITAALIVIYCVQ
jgi:hypothetical protein